MNGWMHVHNQPVICVIDGQTWWDALSDSTKVQSVIVRSHVRLVETRWPSPCQEVPTPTPRAEFAFSEVTTQLATQCSMETKRLPWHNSPSSSSLPAKTQSNGWVARKIKQSMHHHQSILLSVKAEYGSMERCNIFSIIVWRSGPGLGVLDTNQRSLLWLANACMRTIKHLWKVSVSYHCFCCGYQAGITE